MADMNGYSENVVQSGPDWTFGCSYHQDGRDAGGVNYYFGINLKLTEGSFGYGSYVRARVCINGTWTGWTNFGGSNTWSLNETRSLVIDPCWGSAGVGGGLLTAYVEWNSSNGSATSCNHTHGGEVTLSTFNTPPSMPGNPAISLTYGGGACGAIIPENTPTLWVTWPGATDAETTAGMHYDLYREIDHAPSFTMIYGSAPQPFGDTVGAGNPGQVNRYAIIAYDNYGAGSNAVYSAFVTKNVLTKATLASVDSFLYGDGSIVFTVTGASNTDGSGVTYSLACAGLTTMVPSLAGGTVTFSATLAQVKAIMGALKDTSGTWYSPLPRPTPTVLQELQR